MADYKNTTGNSTPGWGALVVPTQPYAELVDLAGRLEAWDFSSIWYPDEKFFRDCYIGLTLIAKQTRTVRLGPCVTDPYSRHPIQTAVAIGSLAEVAPGRVCLGIGAGGRGIIEIGIQPQRPAVAIREAVDIIRRLLKGETVSYSGQVVSLKDLPLDFKPPAHVPIMIGTGHGPWIQQLAGEIADVVMLANFASPLVIARAMEMVEKGAAKANRSLKDFELIARVDVAVAEDRQAARDAIAPRILSAMRSSYPDLNYLDLLPEFELSSKFIQVLKKKDHRTKTFYARPENSAPLIPPLLADHLAIAGTPAEVADRMNKIAAMSLFREITIALVACEGQTLSDAFQLFAEKVMPAVSS